VIDPVHVPGHRYTWFLSEEAHVLFDTIEIEMGGRACHPGKKILFSSLFMYVLRQTNGRRTGQVTLL
jgi:hypothetical protein